MAVVLGLVAAGSFGAADFLGGFAARRAATGTVLVTVQAVGLVLALAASVGSGGSIPPGSDVLLALAAGTVGMASLGLLYRGLATGRMGVVAPISAVLDGAIPVGWGLVRGERPSAAAATGVALAIGAVALVARSRGAPERGEAGAVSPLAYAVASGIGFGITVSMFSEIADHPGYWPLVFVRLGGLSVVGVALAATRRLHVPRRADARVVVSAGVLDVTGNAAILEGFRHGLTSIVAPVSALFPAATVLLARFVLDERIARHQVAGIGVAMVGLVLMGAG